METKIVVKNGKNTEVECIKTEHQVKFGARYAEIEVKKTDLRDFERELDRLRLELDDPTEAIMKVTSLNAEDLNKYKPIWELKDVLRGKIEPLKVEISNLMNVLMEDIANDN